mgnify:CR=1 FL=1
MKRILIISLTLLVPPIPKVAPMLSAAEIKVFWEDYPK